MNRSFSLGAAIAAAAILAATVSVTEASANPFAWPGFPLFGYGQWSDDGNTVRADLRRRVVDLQSNEAPGTIIIDTPNTYLYLVLAGGKAIRYGIGVGREGFTWSGVKTIERKAEWPDWTPPPEMIARSPYLPRFTAGGPAIRSARAPCISAAPSTVSMAPTRRPASAAGDVRVHPDGQRGRDRPL